MTKMEAIEYLEKDIKLHELFNETKHQEKAIEALKIAIEALNKKTGYWMETGNEDPCWYRCSECGRLYDLDENYCPGCGAKMEGNTK